MLLVPFLLALDLRLELVRESLTGTHYRYRQYVDGQPVVGGEVDVTVRADGSKERSEALGLRRLAAALESGGKPPQSKAVNANGTIRYAREEVVHLNDFLRVVRYVDVETNEVIREERHFANGKRARVFDPNPVAALNDPALQDQNNSGSAVPAQAYKDVELDVRQSGPLGGPYAQIVDVQNPAVAPVDASGALTFDRGQSGFEDVNAYFHVDQAQRYLQSLGYTGARAVAQYPVEIDTHAANGSDNSFFISTTPGRGVLYFGEGGTDDAEDSDLVIHEYAHAIHDWISPGTFLLSFNSQARAISEGFGDYWAFSQTYEKTLESGRDPFCFAEWDARCANDAPEEHCGYPPGADCLRRLDSARTIADFIDIDSAGTEHRNGEIWSSALREIFLAAGKRTTDTIVIESFFGAPPNPSFASMARRMMAADRVMSGGANANTICAAMTKRGILSDCLTVPRGELTFFQSAQRGVVIPDNDPAGVTLRTAVHDGRSIERLFVNVNIAHQSRGDLRIVLVAPDGSEVVLQEASLDRSPDVNAIYGRDTISAQPLDLLRGRAAAGEWKLRVSDVRPADRGSVMSWSLVIQFEGEAALAIRPASQSRQTIAAAAHAPGANGTYFVTDLRLFNRQSREVTATLIFTPSGADGHSDFAAIKVAVAPGEVVAFDDVVGVAFQTAGGGQIEIDGDLIATSRTYTRSGGGTFGQFIPALPMSAANRGDMIPQLVNNSAFRSNIGFAEVSGEAATVTVAIGGVTRQYLVPPFGHVQVPVREGGDELSALIFPPGAGGRVLAYGSVIDNRSGDSVFVPAEELAATSRAVSGPVISAPGAHETNWQTNLNLASLGNDIIPSSAKITFVDSATAQQETAIRGVPSGSSVSIPDVLQTLWSRRGLGVLRVDLTAWTTATSRIWTGAGDGTMGQFVPFAANPTSTTPLDLLHVENTVAFRTNLGVYSPESSRVRVTVYDSGGEALEQHEIALQPWRLVQFPVGASVVNGRAHIDVLSGSVIAYASMIDNVSGDPIFVPGQ